METSVEYGASSAGGPLPAIIGLAIAIFFIVVMWKVFTKAGQPGWGSLIPIYNIYLMLLIAGKPGWWLILFFVPIANIVVSILVIVGMAAAGLADLVDVRTLILTASLLLVAAGAISLFLPGLGQPAAEWKRAVAYLRGSATAPSLGFGRPATLADIDKLALHQPILAGLNVEE